MDINSIQNSSIYGSQSLADEKKPAKKTENTVPNQKQPVDKLELSDEAKLSKLLDYNSIKERIKLGFYDNPDVLKEVAQKLSKEFPIEAKE